MDDGRNAEKGTAPERDPRSADPDNTPLTVDKETLKDIDPGASDQDVVRGGRVACVHTGSNCP
jgi:hypothetical protein